ncbi:hypothetical protein BD1_28 [Octadecabacter Antarctic BD virus 1]|nr:hypothetical protein BD1_28 [Octadecabacter Antarctic BD virus 1]
MTRTCDTCGWVCTNGAIHTCPTCLVPLRAAVAPVMTWSSNGKAVRFYVDGKMFGELTTLVSMVNLQQQLLQAVSEILAEPL